MTDARVLITGGAGYLGNRITRDLLDDGYRVTCLDDLRYGQQESIFPLASNPEYEFVFGDARDKSLVSKLVSDADVIIPLAAIVGAPACDQKSHDSISINYGAVKLLDELRSPDQKLICPISNSGYGTKTGEDFCTEESPLDPISLYGKTKVDAENVILGSDKPAISLRLATVFGVGGRPRRDLMVNDFVYQAMTNRSIVLFEGDFKRNFVGLPDVSKAFIHSIDNFENMSGEAYNVGLDAANMSKRELAEKVKVEIPNFEIFESEKGTDPDKRDYIVSNEKMRRAGFEASFSIEDGIREIIKGYEILLHNIPHTNM